MPQLEDSIVIGIDADMSSASAHSGESIRRGVMVAVDEINESGGLFGRPLEIVVRDHRGNPARGIDNINELACIDNLVAIVGGIHTPVALEELDAIHDNEVIYLGPWAAGTPLTSNGRNPNFVFRVSVRDEYAGEFLVSAALDRDLDKIGLLLERTGWGRSNHTAMTQALNSRGLKPIAVEWFHWGEPHLANQVNALLDAGCETVLLVCNPLEGVAAVQAMAEIPSARRVPIVSHWGLTGGKLPELAANSLRKVDLVFLQTYSFINPPRPERAAEVLERYQKLFPECASAREVFAPVGTAHAYELVHMLAAAVRSCGSLDRQEVRRSLEAIQDFDGLIRHYERPFQPELHDALTIDDFHLARFDEEGVIVVDDSEYGVEQP
ncbi:MAG: ABC transporter substrate-binding protein [Planctomycetota bacterium]